MVTTSRPASVGYAEAVLSGALLGLVVLPLIALRLALITLFTNYTHVDLLGATSVDLPQQAGIPCIAAAVAAAIEQQAGIQRSTSTWSATRSSRGCNGSRKRTSGSTSSAASSVQSCPAQAPARALRTQLQASPGCDLAAGGVRGNGLNSLSDPQCAGARLALSAARSSR